MGEREITPRSDVYALGAVLYEMLTGDPPFTGSTAQAVVARVVTESPRPLVPQRHTIPPHVEAAVLTALEKLPADRFASAAQFAEALGNRSYASTTATAALPAAAPGAGARGRRGAGAYAVGGALVLALAAALWGWLRPGPAPVVNRYSLFLRSSEALQATANGSINVAISPDGKRVAYVGPGDGGGRIWLREHDKLRPLPINGTEGGNSPFFSPDGRSLGFLVGGRTVRVISLGGGPAITLSDSINSSGGDWGSDGYVYIEVDSGIARIRATGGPQEPVYRMAQAKKEIGTEFPNVLPGAKGMIFRLRHAGQAPADYDIMAMKLPNGEAHSLMHGLYARYALPGQLLVVTGDGKLLAVPFDADKLAFTGPPVAMLEGMRAGGFESNLATSAEGTLVYVSGGSAGLERAFWVGRDGAATPVDSAWDPQGVLNSVSLSPDGKALAVGLVRGAAEDIWVKQLPAGTFSRVTFGDSIHNRVSWTADGRSVLYLVGSQSSGVPAVTRADGTGTPRILYRGPMGFGQAVSSRDGRWLLLRRVVSETGNGDIYALRTGDSALTALLTTPAREVGAALSPDGKWLAYGSDESGRAEVYVRPFPNVGSAKWQVSLSGGFTPVWAHSGKELFYLNGSRELVDVTVQPGATFTVSGQKVLFPAASYSFVGGYATYDVAPDDRRFVMIRSVAPSAETELVLVQNWAEELKTRSP
jgi:serine/threonine-protein kinase